MGSESPEGDLALFFRSNNSEHVEFEIFVCFLTLVLS